MVGFEDSLPDEDDVRKKRTDAKRMGAMKKFPQGRKNPPAPIYDIVGWVTEHEAADIKSKVDPPEHGGAVNRTTIGRWRAQKFVQGFDLNGALILVNLEQVKAFKGVPLGNPALVQHLYPPEVEMLPDEITITLRRRKGSKGPNKSRSEWDG